IDFEFQGNPNIVVFYSGEQGRDFNYKEKRITTVTGSLNLSFSSNVQNGTQANQLKVMLSKNFNGEYDYQSIQNAGWTDITNRFLLGTSATFRASGANNIYDLIGAGHEGPFYIAFQYTVLPQSQFGPGRTWGVQAFLLSGVTSYGATTIANMTNTGFRLIEQYPSGSGSSVIPSLLTFRPNNTQTETASATWMVSSPIRISNIDLGPDRPIPIKNNTSARLGTYSHQYNSPGVYKATFVAINANIDAQEEVIREIELTITD